MKKSLIITLAALVAGSALATNVVTSANIVGYTKQEFTAGQFLIVAPQFSASNSITLNNAFSGLSSTDVVYTWNGSVYSQYTYYGPTYGWLDSAFAPAGDVEINLGDGVWLKSSAATNVLMSGDCPSADSITNSLVAGTLNMIANPYPVELALDDIPVASLSSGDIVYLWNGSIYAQYTYYGATYGWLDSAFAPSGGVKVPVGDGFWLQSASGGDIVFDKQY